MEKKSNSWVKWVVNGYWLFQLLRRLLGFHKQPIEQYVLAGIISVCILIIYPWLKRSTGMLMNDKQREIIDKLNRDNEALNQGHKSMVEYSKGMICIGSLIVCFLIYYFTKYTFQFGF